jgi:hypothetical protein
MRFVAALAFAAVVVTPFEVEASTTLPLRKVVLYKNGMGFFEHLGEVQGGEEIELVLSSSQLNDVLKSLTVLDLSGGKVSAVTYDSSPPDSRRLEESPFQIDDRPDSAHLLNQLRGAKVEVQSSGSVVRGQLVGAEKRPAHRDGGIVSDSVVVLIYTSRGELRTFEMDSVRSIRFIDESLAERMTFYLDTAGNRLERDVRRVRIQTAGAGTRSLYISYISEAPIWKATYRLVLESDQEPLLQGWAIVDNTTEMDWKEVELSLVAGAPVSFIQELSQPLYGRRPVVPLAAGVQVNPQTYESTLGQPNATIAGTVTDETYAALPGATVEILNGQRRAALTDERGYFQVAVRPGIYTVRVSLTGFTTMVREAVRTTAGSVTDLNFELGISSVEETVTVTAESPMMEPPPPPPPPGDWYGRLAHSGVASPSAAPPGLGMGGFARRQRVAASGRELGDQFEYAIEGKIDVPRDSSAMLPIVQSEIKGEKVTVFTYGEDAPRFAVWLENTSDLTLDGGSVAILDENTFAGEGLIETLQAGESRLLSFAVDLGVEVSSNEEEPAEHVERVVVRDGLLWFHRRVESRRRYTVRNNDERPRRVILEHPIRADWELDGSIEPLETSASFYRFRIDVPPKTTQHFDVAEASPQKDAVQLSSIGPEHVEIWLEKRKIDGETVEMFRPLIEKQKEIRDLTRRMGILQGNRNDIFGDQKRVRDNLQSLGKTREESELRRRYVEQLESQEDRLQSLAAEIDELKDAVAARRKEMADLIEDLVLDKKLSEPDDWHLI